MLNAIITGATGGIGSANARVWQMEDTVLFCLATNPPTVSINFKNALALLWHCVATLAILPPLTI